MKKLIFLLLLIPAMINGQIHIGGYLARKGGRDKTVSYTIYYMPWGAIGTVYIGQSGFLTPKYQEAQFDSIAEIFWYSKFYDELNWRPPLSYNIGNGEFIGSLPGGNYPQIEKQVDDLIILLKQIPVATIIGYNQEIIYKYTLEE